MKDLEQYAGGTLKFKAICYDWFPEDANGVSYDVTIRIKIFPHVGGRFQSSPDHRVKTPTMATPYSGGFVKDTPEEALRDCIKAFKQCMGTAAETQ